MFVAFTYLKTNIAQYISSFPGRIKKQVGVIRYVLLMYKTKLCVLRKMTHSCHSLTLGSTQFHVFKKTQAPVPHS